MNMDESVRNHMGELGLALCEARTLLKAREEEISGLKEFIQDKMKADQIPGSAASHQAAH